jgi:hypothetical protein
MNTTLARPDVRRWGHPRWDGSSLLLGHPGIAVLHATLSVADSSWAGASHAHLARAGSTNVADLVPAAVLHRNAHGGDTKLLRTAGAALAKAYVAQVEAQRKRAARHGPGLPMSDYNVVSGLAGKGTEDGGHRGVGLGAAAELNGPRRP